MPSAPTQTRPLVVLADDDATFRYAIRTLLERSGYAVLECEDGFALVSAVRGWRRMGADPVRPSAIVSDLRMPGMNGLEAIRRLGSVVSGIPVLLLSGSIDDATRAQARDLGVRCVIDKPFEPDALVEAIGAAISETRAEAI